MNGFGLATAAASASRLWRLAWLWRDRTHAKSPAPRSDHAGFPGMKDGPFACPEAFLDRRSSLAGMRRSGMYYR